MGEQDDSAACAPATRIRFEPLQKRADLCGQVATLIEAQWGIHGRRRRLQALLRESRQPEYKSSPSRFLATLNQALSPESLAIVKTTVVAHAKLVDVISPPHEFGPLTALLCTVVVAKDHQRRGIGRQLVEYVIQKVSTETNMSL